MDIRKFFAPKPSVALAHPPPVPPQPPPSPQPIASTSKHPPTSTTSKRRRDHVERTITPRTKDTECTKRQKATRFFTAEHKEVSEWLWTPSTDNIRKCHTEKKPHSQWFSINYYEPLSKPGLDVDIQDLKAYKKVKKSGRSAVPGNRMKVVDEHVVRSKRQRVYCSTKEQAEYLARYDHDKRAVYNSSVSLFNAGFLPATNSVAMTRDLRELFVAMVDQPKRKYIEPPEEERLILKEAINTNGLASDECFVFSSEEKKQLAKEINDAYHQVCKDTPAFPMPDDWDTPGATEWLRSTCAGIREGSVDDFVKSVEENIRRIGRDDLDGFTMKLARKNAPSKSMLLYKKYWTDSGVVYPKTLGKTPFLPRPLKRSVKKGDTSTATFEHAIPDDFVDHDWSGIEVKYVPSLAELSRMPDLMDTYHQKRKDCKTDPAKPQVLPVPVKPVARRPRWKEGDPVDTTSRAYRHKTKIMEKWDQNHGKTKRNARRQARHQRRHRDWKAYLELTYSVPSCAVSRRMFNKERHAVFESRYRQTNHPAPVLPSPAEMAGSARLVTKNLGPLGNQNWLHYPVQKKKVHRDIPKAVVAIDPGIATFATGYGSDGKVIEAGSGRDGLMLRNLALGADRLMSKIKSGQSINKKHRKSMKKAFRRKLQHITNKVTDMHWKLAKTLCESYTHIQIPQFSPKSICNKTTRVISTASVRSAMTWSHFKFRERLKSKAEEYHDCKVTFVREDYTTKTCSSCGRINSKMTVKDRVFHCLDESCGIVIGRDMNAAKNILLRALLFWRDKHNGDDNGDSSPQCRTMPARTSPRALGCDDSLEGAG